MKKKKPIIITTAVIILCIITLILGIKVVQKKKEVQIKQELIQSQEELINYIKNDGMNVENKDIYTARIEKVTTQEELDPIKQEYEKETEVLREAIEEEKAELIEGIGERVCFTDLFLVTPAKITFFGGMFLCGENKKTNICF